MATTTTSPAPAQETEKKAPLNLTPQAIAKVREIMATQDPSPRDCASGWWAAAAQGSSIQWLLRTRAG